MSGILRGAGVGVAFGPVRAVDDVDVTVGPGELVAVTGPSGAGKSTLLAALSGLRRPSSGTVTVGEHRILDRDGASAQGVVLIPQGNALVQMFSALENAALPLLGRRQESFGGDALDDARVWLDAVGLGEAADQLVEELSGGQQQRLALARGLAESGSVILADEPTSELDATNRGLVMRLLRAEADRGAGVLVTTHDPEAAAECDAELSLDTGVGTWLRDERVQPLL